MDQLAKAMDARGHKGVYARLRRDYARGIRAFTPVFDGTMPGA